MQRFLKIISSWGSYVNKESRRREKQVGTVSSQLFRSTERNNRMEHSIETFYTFSLVD